MAHKSTNATWQDYPSTATQVTAARLENIENTIDSATMPTGGAAFTFLKKNTATNYDAGWVTLGTSDIGTGTPAAGKYVDGGTGAWTTLPAGSAPWTVPAVNQWITNPFATSNSVSSQPTTAARTWIPVSSSYTVGAAEIRLTTAGAAGSTATVTLYADDGTGRASSTSLGTVTISTASAGYPSATFTGIVVSSPGFWAGITFSDPAARMYTYSQPGPGAGVNSSGQIAAPGTQPGYYWDTAVPPGGGSQVPLIAFQRTA